MQHAALLRTVTCRALTETRTLGGRRARGRLGDHGGESGKSAESMNRYICIPRSTDTGSRRMPRGRAARLTAEPGTAMVALSLRRRALPNGALPSGTASR
jgi:hypothetical protein